MKILIIDEEFPYPLNTGKRLRSFNLTKVLAQHNDVAYLAYGDINSKAAGYLREHNIETIAVPPHNRVKHGLMFYIRLFLNLFCPLPYIVTSHRTKYYQEKLNKLIATSDYDIVICEWTPYAIFIKPLENIKKIVVAHNIESFIWNRYVENESNLFKRIYTSLQRDKVHRFEKICFFWSDGATAVSDLEAEVISEFGVEYNVETVDNGVDLEYFKPQDNSIISDELVFTGSMDWRPNQDAVQYFVEDVLPLIRKTRPSIMFTAVGRKPPDNIVKLGEIDGVTITGTVDDVRPYIARAALYVVPLRIGGGSRLKILEAMAMQKPILSTTVGAEGLHATPGEHIAIADGAQGLADEVIACLDNKEGCAHIALNGLKLVQSRYSWSELGMKLDRYLKQIVAK